MWELFVVEGADGRMKVAPTPLAAPCEKSLSGFKAARFPQSFMKIKCWLQKQQVRNRYVTTSKIHLIRMTCVLPD